MSENKPSVGLGNSLEKFFADSPVPRRRSLGLSGLRGETLAFQVVYRSPGFATCALALDGAASPWACVRRVELAHVEHPTYSADPSDLIGRAPGFYPDPLVPCETFRAFPGQTRAVWVSLRVPDDAEPGAHALELAFQVNDKAAARLKVTVDVVALQLPPQDLKIIHWFHNDCLMSHYGFDAWSPPHWRMAETYLRNAAEHGVNVITTPVFTPPLDTAVGTERPTVQLVDVTVTGRDRYRFGFSRLGKWIDLCRRCGMSGFEISHLSTQWGALHAPKVMARVNGREKRIFGWEDSSTGDRYRAFLLQFLPKLVAFLKRKHAAAESFLHVSDEPRPEHLAQYGAVREILQQGAPELPVLEALSDLDFYQQGMVDIPVPATNHAQPFLEAGVAPLWCYYCCGQTRGVSNRFLDFPSARNRILGWQLFKFGFEGFLQWGYNHWYEGLTDKLIDPYTNTHAGRPLPPGDGFVVYPGPDGPVDSLRWEVFREGLQDMRALALLRELAGRKPDPAAASLLALRPIHSLTGYPATAQWILNTRKRLNQALATLAGA